MNNCKRLILGYWSNDQLKSRNEIRLNTKTDRSSNDSNILIYFSASRATWLLVQLIDCNRLLDNYNNLFSK